jgi:hypothetical protein
VNTKARPAEAGGERHDSAAARRSRYRFGGGGGEASLPRQRPPLSVGAMPSTSPIAVAQIAASKAETPAK